MFGLVDKPLAFMTVFTWSSSVCVSALSYVDLFGFWSLYELILLMSCLFSSRGGGFFPP